MLMQKNKRGIRFFGSDRAREWVTDFMIGIAMFVLVAFFASTHTRSAQTAPLAKPQAALEQSGQKPEQQLLAAKTLAPAQISTKTAQANISDNTNYSAVMVFMALVFSALLSMTIQFWRNLRREYASPRRKWGKG